MKSTITSNGRITIPKEAREHLGVKPGDRVSSSSSLMATWRSCRRLLLPHSGIAPKCNRRLLLRRWMHPPPSTPAVASCAGIPKRSASSPCGEAST